MSIVLPPGGILIGLGCDLIETDRIKKVLEKHGDRFLKRVFTDEERAYCPSGPVVGMMTTPRSSVGANSLGSAL